MISMQMQKSQQAHMAAPAYGAGPATSQQQQQDWGAQPASYASATPHNTPDPSSTGAPIGTVVGVADAPPARAAGACGPRVGTSRRRRRRRRRRGDVVAASSSRRRIVVAAS